MLLSNNIGLSIGGINLKIISCSKKEIFLGDSYKSFMTRESKHDLVLYILDDEPPLIPCESKNFSSDLMDLHAANNKIIISFKIPQTHDPFPFRLLIIDSQNKIAYLHANFDEYTKSPNFQCYLLRPILELIISCLLSHQHLGTIIHACGITYNDNGIIFTGPSGSGKTTIAKIWQDNPVSTILSDESIIIRKINGQFWIYGTPWHEQKLFSSGKCHLQKVFFIKHSKSNVSELKRGVCAVIFLLNQSQQLFCDSESAQFILDFLVDLSMKIPCYELGFVPDKNITSFVKNI